MSTTIDQKVVEMQFDNKQFESNVQTSISSIENLKQKLDLTGASKGLENIDSASRKINLSGLSGAVESVGLKFNAMYSIADQAFRNITNSAMAAGKRMMSSFTVDPIKTGLQEYETQINAVQTILANTESKGTTLKDVNGALDQLNAYADKTIYNFTEMTRNIGTFTAAGVDLETSVSSIQGIANLAAVSGSTSQQASTAMYQLSQALSSGTVKLQDWNSVVNAGMGGQVFQDALKRTAKVMGTDVDALIKKYGSFRESLTQGEWLTSDVLNKTLEQFTMAAEEGSKEWDKYKKSLMDDGYTEKQAEEILKMANTATNAATKVKTFTQLMDTLKEAAQSGWTQTWEILIGDFEQAKELWTSVSDVFGEIINSSSEARNTMLKGWADLGGREKVIDGIKNAFEGVMNIITPISEAFREIFPPTTSEQLYSITESFAELTGKFREFTEKHSGNIKSAFKGIFAVLDIVVTAIKEVVGGAIDLLGHITGLGGGILDTAASFGDWLSGLRDTVKETNVFGTAVQKVTDFLGNVIDKIKEFFSFLKEKIAMPGLEGFLDIMQSIWDVITKVGSKISKIGSSITEGLLGAFRNGDMKSGLDLVNGGLFAGLLVGLNSFTGSLKNMIGNAGGLFGDIKNIFKGVAGDLKSVQGILDGVQGALEGWQQNLKAGALLKIASAIGILAVAILIIATIDPVKLAASLGAITVLFGDLMGSMAIFNKIGGTYKNATKAVTTMIGMSVAVLILASALKKVADLSFGQLATGLVGVLGLTAIMVAAAKVMASESKKVIKGATQMVIMAAALKILASVCEDLSALSWGQLAKGLVGVAALMAEVSLFMMAAKYSGNSISTATGVVILAAAIKILASACSDFGQMKWSQIGKGLAAIAGLLAELIIFTKLTGNAKNIISTGIALVLIGASMKIFASAVKDFGGMKWVEIGRGLTAMAGALAAVTLAMNFMPKNMIGIGMGLVIVSSSLLIITSALKRMGGMSWDEITKGLVTLGVSIGILAIGLNAMNGTLAGSAAILIASGALTILAGVLKTLGDMSWGSIIKGLVSIAGTFAVLGIAAAILQPLIPSILALSASIALFGVGCLAAGAGILLVAAGLTALGVALGTAATSIVAGLAVIVIGILDLVPAIVQIIGDALILLCQVIIQAAPLLGEAVKAVVLMLIDVLVQCVPPLADGLLQVVVGVLAALATYTPQIVDSLFQFLIGILDSVAANLPALIQSGVNVLMAFFQGIVDALNGIDTSGLIKGIIGVGFLAGLMLALSAIAGLVPGAMVGVLAMGALIAELALVLAAIGGLAQIPGLSWLIEEGSDFLQKVGNAIGKFIGGLAGGIAEGISASLPQIGTDLSSFMKNAKPFIDGAKSIDESALNGVQALVDIILKLTAANIIEGLTSWFTGGSSLTKFGSEIAAFGPYMKAYANAVAGIDGETVVASANAAKALAEMTSHIPNEGGVAAWFAGENSISKFGSEIVVLGENLSAYSTAVTGFKAEAVEASINAATALAEMTSHIPNEGGVSAWFAGENSISSFADQLPLLGDGLKGFSDSIKGMNAENVTAAANAAKAIAEMTAMIPNEGGVVAWFTGENSISKFADRLPELGKGLKGFSDSVKGINAENITSAANASKTLAEMAKTAPADTDKLKSFGSNLTTFGTKLKTFYTNLNGVSGESIKTAGSAIKSVNSAIGKLDSSKISSVTKSIDELVKALKNTTSISEGSTSGFVKSLNNLGTISVKKLTGNFKDAEPKMKKAGQAMITSFVEGVNNKEESAKKALGKIADSCAKAVGNKKSAFKTAGKNLVDGFADGITAQTWKAEAKAKAMADAAEKAAKKALDVNSPSKVFRRLGYSVPEGFAMGIDKLSGMASTSSTSMANTAIEGVKKSISRIADIIGSDFDSQPTIRPVLDLSEIESGAGAINGMFGMTPSVGLLSRVGSINATMNRNNQNGTNDDVVSAINKLRKDLGKTSGDTYNINGVTYDDGSNVSDAVSTLVRAARIERRV